MGQHFPARVVSVFLWKNPDFAFPYPNPKTNYESIEPTLLKDSEDHILIRMGCDPKRFLSEASKRIFVASGIWGSVGIMCTIHKVLIKNPPNRSTKPRWTTGALQRKVKVVVSRVPRQYCIQRTINMHPLITSEKRVLHTGKFPDFSSSGVKPCGPRSKSDLVSQRNAPLVKILLSHTHFNSSQNQIIILVWFRAKCLDVRLLRPRRKTPHRQCHSSELLLGFRSKSLQFSNTSSLGGLKQKPNISSLAVIGGPPCVMPWALSPLPSPPPPTPTPIFFSTPFPQPLGHTGKTFPQRNK